MSMSCTIVLAAGGTGGHIFPAEALAEELNSRDYKAVLITDRRASDYKGILGTLERHTVRAGTFGRGLKGKITAATDIMIGVLQALAILRRIKPHVVVGFGGYPSFPTIYAASLLGIPTIIHEQNSVLGRANRVLIGRATVIATTFPDTKFISAEHQKKTILTGNPVRAAIRALHNIPYPELNQDSNIRILVTGGSQGASIFSQIVPAAIAALPGNLRARIRVDQQCRKEDVETTRAVYAQMNVSADILPFFSDIPARLAAAHLVIARAGASTIAELTAAGRPSILVPLPSSMDNHQYYNASSVEEAGGAWMIPQEGFTAASLSNRIEAFLSLPDNLARAAANARAAGKINAASDLAAITLNVAAEHSLKTVL
ncbi:MAG TPA: undecaprenyldiphospho-muramoylpentapeptide beta-N-acetylglucosaminyltransferase [Rickettsiales bacterium]|nr:undecaprenyldiphospho-muramoylpentapeptide beta-N-acetylglucosaminyltransferase [Rickettsiales bacterium]